MTKWFDSDPDFISTKYKLINEGVKMLISHKTESTQPKSQIHRTGELLQFNILIVYFVFLTSPMCESVTYPYMASFFPNY